MSRITGESNGVRRNEGMAGLAKGLAIIEAFGPARPYLTISQAAELVGLSPASARRCLLTLVEAGYLLREGTEFHPTPRMVRLSAAYLSTSSLGIHAQRFLEASRDALGESVSLAVLDGHECLFIARASAVHVVSTGVSVGARLPAYASATGRVLLAAKSQDEIRELLEGHPCPKLTPFTITDPKKLMSTIESAKQLGYALSSEELEMGMRSLAVPVVDSREDCVGAMSVSAFSGRYSPGELVEAALPILKEAAEELGKTL